MRFTALATDFDGTLAHDGEVTPETVEALRSLRHSGRRVILVTGRTLASLRESFPRLGEFDAIVAENGGTLYDPHSNAERILTTTPAHELVALLQERSPFPIEVGQTIIATTSSEKQMVLNAIHDLGLELQIIFNKGSLMILPSGVNKATGLHAAAKMLGLSLHNIVSIGDAENDHAFLMASEFSVAVQNALASLKERVQLVTEGARGRGVTELAEKMLSNDLAEYDRYFGEKIVFGRQRDGQEVAVPACAVKMITGISGGGKSTLSASYLESLAAAGYQFCVIDPEGDYEQFPGLITVGNAKHVPSHEEILAALEQPDQNVAVNLLGVEYDQRPEGFETLLARIRDFQARTGRPHNVIVDEAHHFLSVRDLSPASRLIDDRPDAASGLTLITTKTDALPPSTLEQVAFLAITGEGAAPALRSFCAHAGIPCPKLNGLAARGDEALGWYPGRGYPFLFTPQEPHTRKVRHRRKYAEGVLSPDRSFYFRGRENKLNLRAPNLITFLNLLDGVDDETWLFHLQASDYSKWFREQIKDDDLADQAAELERAPDMPVTVTRQQMRALVADRYTLPGKPDGISPVADSRLVERTVEQ